MVLGGNKGIFDALAEILATGPLERGGTFGGAACASYVAHDLRFYERLLVVSLCVAAYFFFSIGTHLGKLRESIRLQLAQTSVSSLTRAAELAIGYLCVGLFIAIFLYKLNSNSLCFILQPCHVIILSQGLALIRDDEIGVISQILTLPALGGTVLALLFPETDDLVQPFEELVFWVEHYTLQILPVYLLLRRNSVLLKNISIVTPFLGAWLLLSYHFGVIDVMNSLLHTNVQFMMCPIPPVQMIMNHAHPILLKPSYRTLFALSAFPFGVIGSESYRLLATAIQKCLPTSSDEDVTKKFC